MPIHGVRAGQAASRLLARVPLQVRLAAAACCAVAVAALVIGLCSSLAARASLTAQAGRQLRGYASLLASRPFRMMPAGQEPGGLAAAGYLVEVVSAGRLVLRTAAGQLPGPALARLPVPAGSLATVPADRGNGRWLVLTQPVHYSAGRIVFTYGSDGFFLNVTSPGRPGAAGVLVVALDLRSVSQAASSLMIRGAAVGGAVLLIVLLAALAAARRLLRPVGQAQLTAALRRLEAARHATNESRRSGEAMGSALDAACRELQRPVSVIRGAAASYLARGPEAGQDADHLVDRVASEAAQIGTLIDNLAAAAGRPSRRPPRGRT